MPLPPLSPSLISLMVSVDVKHHVYLLTCGVRSKKKERSAPNVFARRFAAVRTTDRRDGGLTELGVKF